MTGSGKIMEKIPPQNIEAEQAVLGSLLIDKDAIIRVADIIVSEDFYKDIHQIIYSAMLVVWERREPIDILSIANHLEEKKKLDLVGGRSYLASLANSVPTSSHISSYAQIVQKKSILRKAIQASTEIVRMAYEEETDALRVLDRAEQKLFDISQKFSRQNFTSLKDTLAGSFERLDELQKGDRSIRGISTGFTALDNVLAGLQKSELIILAARPSVGKSSLALDIARNAAVTYKVPVGIFSLEMSKEQISDRMICAESGVNLWQLRTGRLSKGKGDGDFKKLGKAIGFLAEAPIFIDDSATLTVAEIRAKARRLQFEHKIELLIVDYLQLMEGERVKDGRVQEVSEISRALKAIARDLNIPVLALSQLSRAPEARTPAIPRLSDLRESGCLTGDTLITKADTGERIPIKVLAERKKQTPFPVMAIEDDYKVKQHSMVKVFSSGKKIVFELKTRSGRKIKASSNHPFLCLNGWTKLGELKTGDYLALPRNFSPRKSKNPLINKELILLAHLLGDGCILPNQPFHYTSADEENIESVRQAAKQIFNINGRIVKQKNWWHIYLTSPYHLTHGKYHPIANWFKKLNIERVRSWKKKIPDTVFQCDNSHIALFLKHLWATDGNLSWKRLQKRKPAGEIYYASSSETLAYQVQHLLLRLNIQSSLREVLSKKYRTMYHVYIESSIEQLKFLSQVGIAGKKRYIIPDMIVALKEIHPNPNVDIIPKQAWKIMIEPAKIAVGVSWRDICQGIDTAYCGSTLFKSGLSRNRMMRVYDFLKIPMLYNLATSDVFWDKIISIKKLGVEEVYDATVKGTHNFVANDIILHNSLEQDSDVVMFIYRKFMDKGIKNCPEEDKNIAEIHISKHRHGPAGVMVPLYFDSATASFKNLDRGHEEGLIEDPF